VEVIEEAALRGCCGLESCSVFENADLLQIDKEALSECSSLRSFYIPRSVEGIGDNCFQKCCSLHRLRFASVESLKKFVDNLTLDEALEKFGFEESGSDFRLEFDVEEVHFEFSGWSSVVDGDSHMTLVHDIP
jgi:hypothetical protein